MSRFRPRSEAMSRIFLSLSPAFLLNLSLLHLLQPSPSTSTSTLTLASLLRRSRVNYLA